MAYDPTVLRRATDALDLQRREHRNRQARLRLNTYAQQPRLEELDRQLQGTMAQLVAAALRKGENARQAVENIKAHNLSLQAERSALLSELGLAPDALDEAPLCPHCGDSGWRGTRMCDCLRAIYAREQIGELSKLLDLGSQSFDAFRLDYYPQEYRPHMEMVFTLCRGYAQSFGKGGIRNLYLCGAPGLGKTFLSAAIARSVSEQGFSVVYDTAGNIFSQFEDRKFQRFDNNQEARDETRRYLNCDLLILDDLGSELTTQFTQTALYELINTRLVGGRRSVISSNLSLEEMARRYSPQIASRIAGEYHELVFFGQDIRTLKKNR